MIQRKPPAKRLFTGLAGFPSGPDEKPVVPPLQPPIPTESMCEYHRYKNLWICLYCSHRASQDDITTEGIPATRICSAQNIERQNKEALGKKLDAKYAEMERRAAVARARRKKKADQLAAIKQALKTPIAVIKEAARVKTEAERLPSMNKGIYMSDAPTGKGALVYKSTNKLDQIDAAINRNASLGSPTIDDETGEVFFAEHDRDRIAPEGTGAPSDEKPEITGVSSKGFTYGDGEESKKTFGVGLRD